MLIVFGASASNSLSSDISRFFTGSPTDKAIWMLFGGAAASIAGAVGLLLGFLGSKREQRPAAWGPPQVAHVQFAVPIST